MGTWRRFGLAIVVAGIAVGGSWYGARHWRPSTETYKLQGLDVADAQGPIDWWTVKAGGADFAYARATAGADTRDQRFADHWRDIHLTGMRRGALHVYSLCQPAADQANNFDTTVPRDADALPPAVLLDFEPDCAMRPPQSAVLDDLRRFLTMIELHSGKPALLKVSRAFESTYRVSAGIPRPVWAIQNLLAPDYAATPWRMWQASDLRRIDGVDATVHWDVVAP